MRTARFTFHRLRRFADLPILAVAALWVLTSPAAADTFTETYYFVTGGIAVSDIEGNGFKDRSPGPDLLPYTDDDEATPENGNSGGTWTFAILDNDGDGVADRIFSCTRRFDDDTYTLTSYSDFERGVIAEGEDWIDLHEALGRGPSADGTLGVDTGDDFEWNDRPNWEGQSNWFWYNNLSANQRGWGGSRYYFEHRNDGKFDEVQGWKKLVNLQTNGDDPRTPGFNEKHREYARGDGAVIKGLLIPVSAIASLKDGELDALFGWYKKDMAAYVRDVLGPKLQDESLSAFVQDEVGGGFNRNTGPVAGGKEIDDRVSVALSSTEGKYSHVEIVFDARKKNLTVNLDGQKLLSGTYADFEGATVNGIRIWTESGAGEENRIYVDDVAVLQDIPLAFIRGEINCDGQGDLSDAVASLNYQFLAGNPPCCLAAADVNGDGSLDLTDAVFWLNFSFLGGGAPADPYPHCAVDWETNLACDRFPGCQ